jgi:hypothetical protein
VAEVKLTSTCLIMIHTLLRDRFKTQYLARVSALIL